MINRKTFLITTAIALTIGIISPAHGWWWSKKKDSAKTIPTLKVGHVGHDHHTALFAAIDNAAEIAKKTGFLIKEKTKFKSYELFDGKTKIANIDIIKVGGGAKMPAALSVKTIDIGLGGTAPVLAAIDKGAPVRLIAPLHSKGDMVVVDKDLKKVSDWKTFIEYVKCNKKPVRIGYKNPSAVAKVIFEEALRHENISFSGKAGDRKVQVIMINVKGGKKLNLALASKSVDGYVGNNPFPAIGKAKGILKVVADLEDLPPKKFLNHPCCCIAGNSDSLKNKRDAIVGMLAVMLQATKMMNENQTIAIDAASHWIGTSKAIEKDSIATSGYSMETSKEWYGNMTIWLKTMNNLNLFKKQLKGKTPKQVAKTAYDFSPLEAAQNRVK